MPDAKPHPRRKEILEIVARLRKDGLHVEARSLKDDWSWIKENVSTKDVETAVFLDRCKAFEKLRTHCLDMLDLAKGAT